MTPTRLPTPEPSTEGTVDHRHLHDKDGSNPDNAIEHYQSQLLTTSLRPHFDLGCSDGRFFVGEDVGIYWKLTTPVLEGFVSPDWYFVPGVPAILDGTSRRPYFLSQEEVSPVLVIEYVSGDGGEERDRTPETGKFWVYEQALRVGSYVIYDSKVPLIEVYQLDRGRFSRIVANKKGRYLIPPLGIQFGLHRAIYQGVSLDWLRAWDNVTGVIFPDADEREEMYRKQADEAAQRADSIVQSLQDMGTDPDA